MWENSRENYALKEQIDPLLILKWCKRNILGRTFLIIQAKATSVWWVGTVFATKLVKCIHLFYREVKENAKLHTFQRTSHERHSWIEIIDQKSSIFFSGTASFRHNRQVQLQHDSWASCLTIGFTKNPSKALVFLRIEILGQKNEKELLHL